MGRTKKWDFLGEVEEKKYDGFLDALPSHQIFDTKKDRPCTCLKKCQSKHSMIVRYVRCHCHSTCEVQWLFKTCSKRNSTFVSQINQHPLIETRETTQFVSPKKRHGMTREVKKLIEYLIIEKQIYRPKKIHVKLSKKKYRSRVTEKPTYEQVKNYMTSRRKRLFESINWSAIKEYVFNHQYHEDIDEDQTFYFGLKFGTGTDQDHLNLPFTSKRLIHLAENANMFHIDATYKILQHYYAVIILGVTDANNKFYPVAFQITSHECSEDYSNLLSSFKDIYYRVTSKEFKPSYMMADAGQYIRIAINENLPSCKQLMCYFHVRFNVKKHLHLVPASKRSFAKQVIKILHECATYEKYKHLLTTLHERWKGDASMKPFYSYILSSWINGVDNQWQIFCSPPGYSLTNSPIESFNRTIKGDFTDRILLDMRKTLKTLEELVEYESSRANDFRRQVKVTAATKKKAKEVLKERAIEQLSSLKYSCSDAVGGSCYTIDKKALTCTCVQYLKRAMCKHLVAVCMLEKIELYGLSFVQEFVARTKRGRKRQRDEIEEATTREVDAFLATADATQSLVVATLAADPPPTPDEEEKEEVSVTEDQEEEPQVTAEKTQEPPAKRRRGRPPNVVEVIVSQKRKPGRPPKATKALEEQCENVVEERYPLRRRTSVGKKQ